ncbi:MAG TPA: hypothetical protein DER23_02140, partial [Clostridiales bacterium]|nr:hypothetical protein [Clostridiales bacterium]
VIVCAPASIYLSSYLSLPAETSKGSVDSDFPLKTGDDVAVSQPVSVTEEKISKVYSTYLRNDEALTQVQINSPEEEWDVNQPYLDESMEGVFIISLSEQEFDMICFVVEREARGLSYEHKQIITWVIVNRVRSGKFPSTVYAVLHSKNQFSTISNYYQPKYMPTDDTIQAVYSVLNGNAQDISKGAVYFYAPARAKQSSANWFENDLKFLFEMEGHRFFKAK